MCTLTIWRESNCLTVTMNRDDMKTRPESPPELQREGQVAFIAPRDEQAGGSWMAVNERGLIACLLNRYDQAPQGRVSRGNIVLQAMLAPSAQDAANALLPALGQYSPFTSILLDRKCSVRVDWTGALVTHQALEPTPLTMFTSSSWQEQMVRTGRHDLFTHLIAQQQSVAETVTAFHCHTNVEGGSWTPMMQRSASHTKSVTRVRVSPQHVEMMYWTRESALARGLVEPDVSLSAPRPISALEAQMKSAASTR